MHYTTCYYTLHSILIIHYTTIDSNSLATSCCIWECRVWFQWSRSYHIHSWGMCIWGDCVCMGMGDCVCVLVYICMNYTIYYVHLRMYIHQSISIYTTYTHYLYLFLYLYTLPIHTTYIYTYTYTYIGWYEKCFECIPVNKLWFWCGYNGECIQGTV